MIFQTHQTESDLIKPTQTNRVNLMVTWIDGLQAQPNQTYSHLAKRLECGAFTAAFARQPTPPPRLIEVAPQRWTDRVTFREAIMKHLKSQRRHSKAFRKEAVELLLTGRTLGELAEQLQVPVSTLHDWKQEYLMDLEHQATDVATLPPLKMQEEIQRLRKENQKLKLHQEILKKALGILSDAPPSGMP
jgi:transposase-like protein